MANSKQVFSVAADPDSHRAPQEALDLAKVVRSAVLFANPQVTVVFKYHDSDLVVPEDQPFGYWIDVAVTLPEEETVDEASK